MKKINEYYSITEDGKVFSHRKRRFMKNSINTIGYSFVRLTGNLMGETKLYGVARLVLEAYVGPPPTNKHEPNHIDFNKQNNHVSNLEWVTHRENILKSRQAGYWKKCMYWLDKKRSEETKHKMALAKHKPVKAVGHETLYFDSIEQLLQEFSINRRMFNRYLLSGQKCLGHRLELV